MAPRRPVREKRTTPEDDFNQIDDFGQNNGFDNKEIKIESAWKQRFKQILSDDRVRIACGIVLLAVALYALVRQSATRYKSLATRDTELGGSSRCASLAMAY